MPLLPTGFSVPEGLDAVHFRLRMLSIHDVVKDYDAVMSSRDHLRGTFGPDSGWPARDLTLEQNLIDLGWHQKEFQRRSSFAYTVVRHDERRVLGCVYIYPSAKKGYDAQVILWVRSSAYDQGLDPILFQTVQEWLRAEWPFERVAFPGRTIAWEDWLKLP